MVTGRITVDAELLSSTDLRLGNAARLYCADDHRWFREICSRLNISGEDITLQWNTLAKITAITGAPPRAVTDELFRAPLAPPTSDRLRRRGKPSAGLDDGGDLPPAATDLVSRRQDHNAAPARSRTAGRRDRMGNGHTGIHFHPARRYVEQVTVSLRPSTVKRIEHDLRQFGCWLARNHPEVGTCADLHREHVEVFKTWLSTHPTPSTGKPLNRVSIKNALINLHCFLTRITEWGYPNAPVRPLMFPGDLPIIDKPLPRFLDDAAAAKLLRATRADPDPLSRSVSSELFASIGIRRGELLTLTVDAVVQIGSAYWLRIPIGKLHNDRYIPLHPQLKELLDDGMTHHRPTGLRTNRLLLERNQPDQPPPRDQSAAAPGPHRRDRQRHRPSTASHPGDASREPAAMKLECHRCTTRPQNPCHDEDLRTIADKTLADEYFAVTEKVEALYDQPRRLASGDEGHEYANSAPRCTAACSATATALDPSRWTATSNPSANPAASSSPPSNSDPPCSGNATTPPPRAKSDGRRFSPGILDPLDTDAS